MNNNRLVSCMVSFMLVLSQNGFASFVLAPAGVRGTLLEQEVAEKPYADSPCAREIEDLINNLDNEDIFVRREAGRSMVQRFLQDVKAYDTFFIKPLADRLLKETDRQARMIYADALLYFGRSSYLENHERMQALSCVLQRNEQKSYCVDDKKKQLLAGNELIALNTQESFFAALECDNEDVRRQAADLLFDKWGGRSWK